MTFTLPSLYHWSPAENFYDIKQNGLKPFSYTSVEGKDTRWAYICFSFDPSTSWSLSGDFLRSREETDSAEWDLWEVRELPDAAETHVLPAWGGQFKEVRIYTAIGADRLWHVGRRGEQNMAVNGDFTPYLMSNMRGIPETMEVPDQCTINTLKKFLDTDETAYDESLDYYNTLREAVENVYSLVPNPEQEL